MRRGPSVVAAVVIALAAVAAVAAPASAHNRVVASTPAADGVLTRLPSRFSITTDQPMLVVGGSTSAFAFDVVDTDGRHYGDGCINVVDDTMTTRAELGAPGTYEVRWQLVSADGHTVSDSYEFTWAPSAAVTPARGHADAQRCGAARTSGETSGPSAGGSGRGASAPIGDVLWIGGAILVVLAGAGAVLVVLTRRRPSRSAPSGEAPDGPAPAEPGPDDPEPHP